MPSGRADVWGDVFAVRSAACSLLTISRYHNHQELEQAVAQSATLSMMTDDKVGRESSPMMFDGLPKCLLLASCKLFTLKDVQKACDATSLQSRLCSVALLLPSGLLSLLVPAVLVPHHRKSPVQAGVFMSHIRVCILVKYIRRKDRAS
jgi:hypothetical protein